MTNIQSVDDLGYGIYVATDSRTGKYVVNENYEHLQIASKKGDFAKIKALVAVAKQCGIEEPGYEYIDGARPISHGEWEMQKERQEAGLVPDEFDLGSLIEDLNYQKRLDRQ